MDTFAEAVSGIPGDECAVEEEAAGFDRLGSGGAWDGGEWLAGGGGALCDAGSCTCIF